MTELALPCIVCDKPLKNVFGFKSTQSNQPYGGTSFHTSGHYGSTIYDEMGSGKHIEINVCDTCLLRAADAQKVLEYEPAPKTPKFLEPTLWQVTDGRHWVLKQNEKTYGSAWGADEPYAAAYEEGEEPDANT